MSNILVMCNLHMICKLPIFSYFTLKSNIHHISNITLHIHIIKINVNSNYFELTSIVHIICQKIHQNIIFYHLPPFPLKVCKISHTTTIRGISHLIPAKFPAWEKFSPIPVRILSGQNKFPFKKTDFIK